MTYDFDRVIDRRNTMSVKWDQSEKLFGEPDVLPLWVADMDFQSPPEVVEAITRRAQEGIYGYTVQPTSYYEAIRGWFQKRHDWEIETDWMTSIPGVVPALNIAVQCFTEPGDQVILQPPVYYPFYDVIRKNGREIVRNPLILENNRYRMDFDGLEQLMKDGAKMLLLCSPHNPGGRVWTREELKRVGEMALKYDVKVVSDEIHCDLVHSGHKHVPFASISEEFAQVSLTCLAPSKTFNLPGIQSAFVVTPNAELRKAFERKMKALSLHMVNFFAPVATEASYRHGEKWLDALLAYIEGNIDFAVDYFAEHLPEVEVMRPEGTYLLWVDYRKLGLTIDEMKQVMFKQAKVAFSEGSVFGDEGKGFLRINLACPRVTLEEALERFVVAVKEVVEGLNIEFN
ncbi:MAG: pyridoxal phosphate-dependent aminotransferase [Bacillaceae bacterium]|nr:pyridoxal phosphate-dependent aminotransferase [Bacillaceae bacterium]